jgi:hypothetical protein
VTCSIRHNYDSDHVEPARVQAPACCTVAHASFRTAPCHLLGLICESLNAHSINVFLGGNVLSQTGRVPRAPHTDYHWDRLRSYSRTSPMLDVSCHVSVMCRVAPFCNVLRCSDTSIGVVGFMTCSEIREELQSYLVYVYKLHT